MECLGCNQIETAPVTLNDGRSVCSSCPAWRLECEARDVLKRYPTNQERTEFLAEVEKKRGKLAAGELRQAMLAEWGKR